MKKTRVIKRYQNRKLYDTSSSSYVTLEDISDMIKCGDEIQIIDNASKGDITSQTLAQIIFEDEKKKKSALPLSVLRNLIQSGGATIRELVQNEFSHVKTFVEAKVKPTLENVQSIPIVQQELKDIKARLEELEKRAKK